MPHPRYMGFVHWTFSPCLWPPEFPGHQIEEDTGFGQGTAGLCRGVQNQDRCPIQSCQGTPAVHGPIDDPQWGRCYWSLPVEACWGGIGTLPHSRSGGHPPGQRRWALGRSANLTPRFVEPAEWITTPVTSAVPCSCSSWKRKKSWKGIDIDPNNRGQWVHAYLDRDTRLPEWWGEFSLLYALWMGVEMMPKSKICLTGKLLHSSCQLLKRRCKAPGSHHPAWQY